MLHGMFSCSHVFHDTVLFMGKSIGGRGQGESARDWQVRWREDEAQMETDGMATRREQR